MADTPLDISGIASSLLTDAKGILLAQGTDFLKAHPSALPFLEKVALEMAENMVDLLTETDPDKKEQIRASIKDDKEALKEEGFSIIVDSEHAAKSLFWTIVEDMGRIALGLAPVVMKAVTGI